MEIGATKKPLVKSSITPKASKGIKFVWKNHSFQNGS